MLRTDEYFGQTELYKVNQILRHIATHETNRELTSNNTKMAKISVAIVGATGETGKSIVNGLVDDGEFVSYRCSFKPDFRFDIC